MSSRDLCRRLNNLPAIACASHPAFYSAIPAAILPPVGMVAMTIASALTIAGLVGVIGFIVFAFRQGTRVKPRRSREVPVMPGEGDTASSGWTTHIDTGGGH